MFLNIRLLSSLAPSTGILLALFTFVLGLGLGATVAPVTASLSAIAPPPAAPAPAAREPAGVRVALPAEVLRVLDGDTFEARVNLWPGLAVTTRVRLRGIDTPELKARCADERAQAEAARETLRKLLAQGEVGITEITLDKYGGRVIANASTSGTPDVAAALVDSGIARRYGGGRRETWC